MIKGHQYQIFSDNRFLGSERVPVFEFWFCPGPLISWRVEGIRFWLLVQLEAKVLSAGHVSAAWMWSVVPEKQLSSLSNRTELFWVGSVVTMTVTCCCKKKCRGTTLYLCLLILQNYVLILQTGSWYWYSQVWNSFITKTISCTFIAILALTSLLFSACPSPKHNLLPISIL